MDIPNTGSNLRLYSPRILHVSDDLLKTPQSIRDDDKTPRYQVFKTSKCIRGPRFLRDASPSIKTQNTFQQNLGEHVHARHRQRYILGSVREFLTMTTYS
eukprot:9502810-Pyramimonas_sp.AAC.4